ncbi:MAG: HAD-IA family hydrolase [Deltaproteobacteria bacterium]|nr:HAD-IA family hydrolase [Deltaproteobacteria bacterium]
MSHPIRAVIFDLDGTLVDTSGDLRRGINHLRQRYGLDAISSERALSAVGRGVEQLVAAVIGEGKTVAIDQAVHEFSDYYLEHCTDDTEPYPGIVDLLSELRQRGIKSAVITNKPQQSAQTIVGELGLPIDLVLGATPTRPNKPDPAVLLEARRLLDVPLASSVYVGDMEIDLACARAADCPFVGVDFGFTPNSQLWTRTAVCVDHVDALRRALLERD